MPSRQNSLVHVYVCVWICTCVNQVRHQPIHVSHAISVASITITALGSMMYTDLNMNSRDHIDVATVHLIQERQSLSQRDVPILVDWVYDA